MSYFSETSNSDNSAVSGPHLSMASSPGAEVPSHRACAHCRSQKVRCIPDDGNPDVCQRCARSGRPCIFTPLQKRKQRKRTDTRVAELEREMRAMRSMLKKKQESADSRPSSSQGDDASARKPRGIWFGESAADTSSVEPQEAVSDATYNAESSSETPESSYTAKLSLWPTRWPDHPKEQRSLDVVEKGILSMATARQLYLTYRDDLFPHYPMVAIPDNVSADELRETKPTLFLAIIAAAAGKDQMELAGILDQEVLQAYATRSLMHSEKSLELVQALLISAVWYHPPQKFGQLKYYEYIHMAATMAMDIGIGIRPAGHRGRNRRDVSDSHHRHTSAIHSAEDSSNNSATTVNRSRDNSPNSANLESRRAFLGCYIICSSVSVSLRRPNMLRASSYIRESVDYLERAVDQIATDRTLASWARLMMIADEISVAFSYDDPGGVATITDLSTRLMLKDFKARLIAWSRDLELVVNTGSLTIMYFTVRLYLHEIALHVDHSPDDFRAPYQMGTVQTNDDGDDVPTQVLAEAISECITSSHALLDTFISMDPNKLRALPVFSFVRVSFGAFVLAKLCLSANSPDSRIAHILDGSSLQAEEFMNRAIVHARKVIGDQKCRVPAIFLALLFKLRQWSRNPESFHRTLAEAAENPSPQDADRASRLEQSGMRRIEGPRIVEQASSGESSPQTSDISNTMYRPRSPPRTDAIWKDIQRASLNSPGPPQRQHSNPDYESLGLSGGSTDANKFNSTSQPSYLAGSDMYMGMNDPMQIDSELLQLWNEVNGDNMTGFPEGGLTGLEDWGSMPLQMMGLGVMDGDGLSWPQQASSQQALQQQQQQQQPPLQTGINGSQRLNFS